MVLDCILGLCDCVMGRVSLIKIKLVSFDSRTQSNQFCSAERQNGIKINKHPVSVKSERFPLYLDQCKIVRVFRNPFLPFSSYNKIFTDTEGERALVGTV